MGSEMCIRDRKRIVSDSASASSRGIDYLESHPNVSGEQTTFFFKTAVNAFHAASTTKGLDEEAQQLKALGDRLSMQLHIRGDAEAYKQVEEFCKTLP